MNAIVCSGGGARGSCTLGMLTYVAETQEKRYPGWFKFFSGTSVGAILSAGIAMYPPYEFPTAVEDTCDLWWKLRSNRDVYRYRWGWLLLAPLFIFLEVIGLLPKWKWLRKRSHSAASSEPITKFLTENIDVALLRVSGIKCRWPIVDIQKQNREESLIETNQWSDDPIKCILASSSFPAIFPLVEMNGRYYTDGGLRDIAPLASAIDSGAEKILVLLSRNLTLDGDSKVPATIASNAHRQIDIMVSEIIHNDIKTAYRKNEKDCYRNIELDVIMPYKPLNSSLDFSAKSAKENFDIGYESAKRYYTIE